jgi:type IV pilus assembly protein PilC
MDSVLGSIKAGKSLNESMAEHPSFFSRLFVSMVKAGEESGNLSESLKVVSSQMEKTYILTKKVKSAFVYPVIILCIMAVVTVIMFVYVVPTITTSFKDMNVTLPWTTQVIISISDFVANHPLFLFSTIFGLIFFLSYFFKTKLGKRLVAGASLDIPVIGNLVREINSARTARTMSSLLKAGVEVLTAVEITEEVIQNPFYKKVLAEARQKIANGEPIAEVFSKYNHLYPDFLGEMISVGEETGKLSDALVEVAIFYENEVDQKTKDMSTIVEPVLMVIIGSAVAFFAVAMISPTYSLIDAI